MNSSNDSTFGGTGTHGGDIWGAARHLGVAVEEILDLSASLNPLGPPPGLSKVLADAFSQICHYPDRQNYELRQALAGHLGLSAKNVLPGNGSTALIRLVARTMELKNIMVLAPCFGEFPRSLALTGRHFHYQHLSEKNCFAPTRRDLEVIWDREPGCVILTNPLTPSGGLVDPEVIDLLLAHAARHRTWVVLDEAFIDFAPAKARAFSPSRLKDHPQLLVLRSMTKFYCMAGLRLGFMMAHEDTIAQLAPLGEPWSVNTLATRAGVYCLAQDEYARKSRQAIRQWRQELSARLQDLGLMPFESQANYLLVRLPASMASASQIAQRLLPQGILLRNCASFPGCDDRHLRIAVCTSEEQDRLMAALEPALKK